MLLDDQLAVAGFDGRVEREAVGPGAEAVLDRVLGRYTLETVLVSVVLPYLRDLGERWARGEASVVQEHFASNLLRGRLFALARGWERGTGPAALLACAPGEQHDLPLIMFGLALRAQGWRVIFLGADTPLASIAEAAASPYSLKVLSWAALLIAPFVLLYQGWTYWVFRRRIGVRDIPRH